MQKDSTKLNKDNTSNEQDEDISLDTMDIENMPVILSEYLIEDYLFQVKTNIIHC